MNTNWNTAFTYQADLKQFYEEEGEARVKEAILALTDAGGTFAVSQGKLCMSDFSYGVFIKLYTDWYSQPTKGTV